MQFFLAGDPWQDRRAAAGKERGCERQKSAQEVNEPLLPVCEYKYEQRGDNCADHVAQDHYLLAIHSIKDDSSNRRGQDGGDCSGDHNAAHGRARPGKMQRQAEDRDAVEVVTYFAYDLAEPGIAVVPIVPEQVPER
jgi:hypothetical protein